MTTPSSSFRGRATAAARRPPAASGCKADALLATAVGGLMVPGLRRRSSTDVVEAGSPGLAPGPAATWLRSPPEFPAESWLWSLRARLALQPWGPLDSRRWWPRATEFQGSKFRPWTGSAALRAGGLGRDEVSAMMLIVLLSYLDVM